MADIGMYKETPRVKGPQSTYAPHQPVVLCIDTSGSMSERGEDGKPKSKVLAELVNSLADIALSDEEKAAVDICILAFDDEVRTLVDWTPLSEFHGGIEFDLGGCTSLSTAILTAIDATRARRKTYDVDGIESRRAQIFLYTDGVSTEDMSPAYAKSQEYLNRDYPSCKLYTILIPPATDPSELMPLGDKVEILLAKDCANGIPATFDFLKASVVAYSQSNPGEGIKVKKTSSDYGIMDRGNGNIEKDENGINQVEKDPFKFEWEF